MRVGLTPTSWIVSSRARQQRGGDDERRRRGEVAGHRRPRRAAGRSTGPTEIRAVACGSPRAPAAASISSVWSRVGTGSTTVVAPVRVEPGEQDARLHLRARHRQLVADPAQLAALDRRAAAVRRSSRPSAPISAQRRGDPVDRPAAQRLVARSARSGRPGPRGSLRAAAASCPSCRSRSARRARAGRAGRRRRRAACPRRRRRRSTPSARIGGDRRLGVAPSAPKPRTRVSPSPIAPSSTARCEIDLSPGTAMCPRSAAAGSILIPPAPARRRRRSPATRAATRRARPRPRRSRAA